MNLKLNKKIIASLILPFSILGACTNLAPNISASITGPALINQQYTKQQLLAMIPDEIDNYTDVLSTCFEYCEELEETEILNSDLIEDEFSHALDPDELNADNTIEDMMDSYCWASEAWLPNGRVYNFVVNNNSYDVAYLTNLINTMRNLVYIMNDSLRQINI